MNQDERRIYLIKALLNERNENTDIPTNINEQKRLLRSLMNVRMPEKISDEFLRIQDEYLMKRAEENGIVCLDDLTEREKDIYLYQGDITRLKCGAIVNAANSELLGCFYPCHSCIDNAIHSFAGIQLRLECNEIMKKQKAKEKTGGAKITSAYNLPCEFVIHTVGPIVRGEVSESDLKMLESCYVSCLKMAGERKIESIAFCCISTGEYCFPNERAGEIAVNTVRKYKDKNKSRVKVIFNVFKDRDYEIYNRLLK